MHNSIKGYRPLDIDDLITNQEEASRTKGESQFLLKSRRAARKKSIMYKSVRKMLLSMLGLGIIFGAFADVDKKMIYTIGILILIQLMYGLKEAWSHVKNIIFVNAQRRYHALQMIYDLILELEKEAKKEAEEKQKKLEAFRTELAKNQVKLLTTADSISNDTYTTDILPKLKKQLTI